MLNSRCTRIVDQTESILSEYGQVEVTVERFRNVHVLRWSC
jgi:hypothetical protein